MLPAGFEPAIPASERPQTHALDRAATGIGETDYWCYKLSWHKWNPTNRRMEYRRALPRVPSRETARVASRCELSDKPPYSWCQMSWRKMALSAMFRTHSTSRRMSFAWPYHLARTLVRKHAIFYISTRALQRMPIFWDVALCWVRSSERFEASYCLIFNGLAVQE